MASLTLFELNTLVRDTIHAGLPETYWLQAELGEVHAYRNGHCYVEFVEKEPEGNRLIAKARGTIWSNVWRVLRPYFEQQTGQAFTAGIKVLVEVSVEFHELYGFSLTVVDIDPSYTLGDLALRRREILRQLKEEGVLTLNQELPLPLLTQRVAVISSATAAGYGDFCDQLAHNSYGLVFSVRLFPAVMQGDRVESSIIAALDAINACRDDWDVVVIIRGGGATSDLSGFDTYLLAASCAQFPLPILTGIGHERDETVLDSVAYKSLKTPTAVAEYLIGHLHETALRLEDYASTISQAVTLRMEREQVRLQRLAEQLPMKTHLRLREEQFRQERLAKQIGQSLQTRLTTEDHRLQLIAQRLRTSAQARLEREDHRLSLIGEQVRAASPQRLLARGYSITLQEGKAVTDASQLRPGDRLVTRFAQGEAESIVAETKETFTTNP